MKAPSFWSDKDSLRSKVLQPIAGLYHKVTSQRIVKAPVYDSVLPVICVGNVTMGGSGKTPVVQSLVSLLNDARKSPAILLRGYGGCVKGPVQVDMRQHNPDQVGDEALLHSGHAPTFVSANRCKGAKLIEQNPAFTTIVMDDGLQNPYLKKDVSFLVVDGENPFGNGRIFPAGPLREKMDDAVKRVQAVVVIGDDRFNIATQYGFICPVFSARLKPVNSHHFVGKPVIAFAGIGRPQKFFDTLYKNDAVVVGTKDFADHHAYTEDDIMGILAQAEKIRALPVTTRKDWVRLPENLQSKISVLDVHIEWRDEAALKAFLSEKGLI